MSGRSSGRRGVDLSAEELAGSETYLVERLRAKIAALKATNWIKAPVLTDGKGAVARPDYTGMVLHQRYRLDSRLGVGGHATVWAARDLKLDRAVAIKIPHLHFESARLLAEARRVAMLKHPQIVPIYDFGSGEGFDFIVSELVEGPSLDQVLCRGPMSLAKTLQLIGDVAEGLDCAHRVGLIHLDVKPSNILLDRAGRGKLCDFGIAVSTDAGRREPTGGFWPL